MERRDFLRVTLGGAAVALGFTLSRSAIAAPARPGPSPYGPLQAADANGVRLPAGFRSRIVARSGRRVAGTGYRWHGAPDGGACFPVDDGWIYVSNAELPHRAGGASAIRFAADGTIVDAYQTLSGTSRNCAGGGTPWQTWLSCEEVRFGYVYETDPTGVDAAVRRDAMGRFTHEAVACDPDRQVIYLTEDEPDGCFYRFRPNRWADLGAGGTLEVLVGGPGDRGEASWVRVPDPTPAPGGTPTRYQVPGAKRFNGGEGCWYAGGTCWFTTKGDGRVWQLDAAADRFALAYDEHRVTDPPLTGVDNITGASNGDLYVAEDGGNMEICVITPDQVVAPFLRVTGHRGSEITGPAFNPAGDRLYFSSQRGRTGTSEGGITFEIRGPFR
ncbi:MAG TPA: alkaline phosphatase PhoX [Natronosporangium sp.]